MRILSQLFSAALLLATAVFAAGKTSTERFQDFNRLSQNTSPLKLNEAAYNSITAAPRDYSVAVLLTAVESRFGCQLCREFQPEWELVGRSWTRGDKIADSRMLFGTLDFSEGRDVFVSVCFC